MTELFEPLVTFALVATISPGGATTLAAASGAQFGFARSLPLLGGIAFGLASLIGMVAGGLGSLLVTWPQSQLWLRLAGSAYLLWLAWTIARLGSPRSKSDGDANAIGFFSGLLLLWVNPKAWSMTAAAAGTFANPSESPFRLALLLGAVFGMAAAFSLTLWCTCGAWLARVLKNEKQWRIVNLILALALAGSVIPMWRSLIGGLTRSQFEIWHLPSGPPRTTGLENAALSQPCYDGPEVGPELTCS